MNRLSLRLATGLAALAIVTPAFAADLLIRQPSAPSYYGPTSSSGGWDGAYIGGFVGYGWGTATDRDGIIELDDDQMDLSGWLAGVTLGANFTLTEGVVAGVVGDLAWSGISGYDSDTDLDVDLNWMGSVRGRLGFDGGAFMPYLTAGLAFGGATANIGANDATQMHFGWTAGAGIEVAATDNVSIDLQYRYTDYGRKEYELGLDTLDLGLTTHAVTAGVNFKF